jgi:HipA-like protein
MNNLQIRSATSLHSPGAGPISLSLPLVEKPFVGDVVHNFFDNLLPDNPQIRTRIQTTFHSWQKNNYKHSK